MIVWCFYSGWKRLWWKRRKRHKGTVWGKVSIRRASSLINLLQCALRMWHQPWRHRHDRKKWTHQERRGRKKNRERWGEPTPTSFLTMSTNPHKDTSAPLDASVQGKCSHIHKRTYSLQWPLLFDQLSVKQKKYYGSTLMSAIARDINSFSLFVWLLLKWYFRISWGKFCQNCHKCKLVCKHEQFWKAKFKVQGHCDHIFIYLVLVNVTSHDKRWENFF